MTREDTDGATDAGATDADAIDADATDEGVSRRSVLKGAGLAALASAPAFASSAGVAEGAVLGGPNGVHVAYGQDPKTSMTVGWTGGPAGVARVRYGEPGDVDTEVSAAVEPLPGRDAFAYRAHLTGLSSDTTYAYEVEMDDTTRGPFEFRTAPEPGQPFRVTAVGDHGIDDPNNPGQRANTDDPVAVVDRAETQLERAPDEGLVPGFHLGVGDISYANGAPSTWELYFREFEHLYASRPFMTAVGNHEAEPGTGLLQYDRRLNDLMPTGPREFSAEHRTRWYDFTFGNATFVALNTTADNCGDVLRAEEYVPIYDPRCSDPGGSATYGEVQERYLREVLEEAEADPDVEWKIVYFHGPLWTTSPDHAPRETLRERWGALFDEYGVDLVLHGDNHVYERSKPIEDNPGERWGEYGATFVVNGTGGTSHYAPGEDADWLAYQTADHFGVTQLDVDEESIDVRYVVATTPGEASDGVAPGETADAFSIVKDDRGRPTQREIVDRVPTSLSVSGSRSDDGTLFRAGETNRIELDVTEASEAVVLRDVVPSEWAVVRDTDGEPYGDATRTESRDGVRYVYFEGVGPAETPSVTYFVSAPGRAGETNAYTFGPFEARVPNGTWQAVPGTDSDEVVVAADPDAVGL